KGCLDVIEPTVLRFALDSRSKLAVPMTDFSQEATALEPNQSTILVGTIAGFSTTPEVCGLVVPAV
ncbi:hypothetical protein, partial [Devosia sp.]|uniref:hypothetical protein n=1 Tax=Devosia sp. TaxID=1871048 RepID=UPI00262664B7